MRFRGFRISVPMVVLMWYLLIFEGDCNCANGAVANTLVILALLGTGVTLTRRGSLSESLFWGHTKETPIAYSLC